MPNALSLCAHPTGERTDILNRYSTIENNQYIVVNVGRCVCLRWTQASVCHSCQCLMLVFLLQCWLWKNRGPVCHRLHLELGQDTGEGDGRTHGQTDTSGPLRKDICDACLFVFSGSQRTSTSTTWCRIWGPRGRQWFKLRWHVTLQSRVCSCTHSLPWWGLTDKDCVRS